MALWRRAGFRPGQTILDLGCGPGYTSIDLAQLVGPKGCVIALDTSARFIDHLRATAASLKLNQIEAQVADAEQLDLPANSIDGAYSRWMFCFLADPKEVLSAVARSLRPGGPIAITDYFNQQAETVAPKSEAIDRVFRAIGEAWQVRGGDPDIAGRLPRLLADCGLEVQELYPMIRIGRPGSLEWEWIETIVFNFLPTMIELGVLSAADRKAFEAQWEERREDPYSFFCSPPVIDIIATKPA